MMIQVNKRLQSFIYSTLHRVLMRCIICAPCDIVYRESTSFYRRRAMSEPEVLVF